VTWPNPGVHFGVPSADYHALEAVGSSLLRDLRRSAEFAAFNKGRDTDEETEAQAVGSLVHALLLEGPTAAASRYVPAGECVAVLKTGANAGNLCGRGAAWYLTADGATPYCGTHAPKGCDPDPRTVLSASAWARGEASATRLAALPEVAALLEDPTGTEVSLVWHDEETELLCKARIDLWTEDVFCDLKVSRCAHPGAWPGEVQRRGGHIQAAHYLAGARALGLGVTRWRWLLVDATEPYEAWAPWCNGPTLDVGATDRALAMQTVAECLRTGVWPGYPAGDAESGLPEYVLSRYLMPEEA